ncbi:hypothetical protein C4G38_RS23400 [Vibrio parahaemolyticus]|nr:hypothetical protein [Vibrio parahaemolyticus]EJG0740358.1 hypothetical protein [Vibrio parahaemolyticus]EJG0918891.1 hypothetical protein [Vibrio parahaemolyticus]
MKWNDIKTVNDLKKLGTFNQVKKIINDDLDGCAHVRARSWESLLKTIEKIRSVFGNNAEEIWVDGFVSEEQKYIFCLVELDGENRLKLLGVSGLHYANKDVAKKWRNKIYQKIHPDKYTDPRTNQAVVILDKLYEEML